MSIALSDINQNEILVVVRHFFRVEFDGEMQVVWYVSGPALEQSSTMQRLPQRGGDID